MPVPKVLKGRYKVKTKIGQGGMGLVYQAYDTLMGCDVAVKIMRDIADQSALELFEKEWRVLAGWDYPNIVTIFDRGEFDDEGARKPFFVMPLLRGTTLAELISTSSHRLTVERSVDIICQACKGLQAAHERGLVHRDLKPSNIFVMEDDLVKIIDFGVAHMVDSRTTRGQKGTLLYMAPEQIEMKPLSALSDIFSLGVVSYETFTHRRPFEGSTQAEVAEAILHKIPPPASEYNPAVSRTLSRVIHKAMAKQPWHRFSSAREFAETLQKAFRDEPIEFFDPSRIAPRIQRARNAFEQADYQFAAEILNELEAEGHLDPEIYLLRDQIHQAIRQKTIRQLLESARTRLEQDEYPLALQKIQEVLQLDPENASALGLKSTIENRREERKIEDWFSLAQQHISNHAYSHARQALQNVLQLRPKESRALQLLAEVNRREQEYLKLRQQKEQLYQAAREAWQSGEVSSALSKMGAVLELDQRAPDTTSPERSATYQNFYNQVCSEHDAINSAYAEARKQLADRNFAKALALCDEYLTKYPGHALFQALKFEVEEQQRQELSAFIAQIDRRVEAEPDLDKRVNILKEALTLHPGEAHFEGSLRLMREKRDLVSSIVAKARLYEERDQFGEALGQWEILRTIYGRFPGLNFEIERVVKRRDQQARSEAKARWVEQIEHHLRSADYPRAIDLSKEAQAEFPNDPELAGLEKLVHQGMERAAQVRGLLAQGQQLCAQQRFEEGLETLRKAYQLDEHNSLVRDALSDALVERAQGLLDSDWRSAEVLIQQALEIDSGHPKAKSLRTLAADHKRQEFVDRCISLARQLQAAGDLRAALAQVKEGLSSYPTEARFIQLRTTLNNEILESRRRDLDELRGLDRDSKVVTDLGATQAMSERAQAIAQNHPSDAEFQSLATGVRYRLETLTLSPKGEPRVEIPEGPAQAQQAAGAPRAASVLSAAATASLAGSPFVPVPPPGVGEVAAPSPVTVPPSPERPSQEPTPPHIASLAAVIQGVSGRMREWRGKPRRALVAAGIVVTIIVGVLGATWYRHRLNLRSGRPPSMTSAPAPPTTTPLTQSEATSPAPAAQPEITPLAPETSAAPAEGAAGTDKPKKARVARPTPAQPEADPRAAQIASLQNLAREAYANGKYAEPEEESAIAYANRVLALDPNDDYAKTLVEDSVRGGKYLVHQAIMHKDFATAHRVADALAQLLPNRNDIAELKRDITNAETKDEAARRPPPVATPVISVRVFHLHTTGLFGSKRYCQGTLAVSDHHLKFTADGASDGNRHNFDFACSDVREIEKSGRSRQGAFRVRTVSSTLNFVPEDASTADIVALKSACSK